MLRRLLQRFRGSETVELPGYTPLNKIREGSMSVLFKASDQETGRIVAVKIHKPEAKRPIDKLETFYRDFTEGQITAAFDHPNIVKCSDHGELGGAHYLVLEYLEGTTLGSLLSGDSKRLNGHRLRYLYEMASALAHVHAKRFTHNDFSPKNVFITVKDEVKLIDFGLSTPLMNAPVQRSRVGTAEILAPEVLKREPCDHRADIFAYGVVAYEVLSGHWPFESTEHHQTLSKVLNVRPTPLDRRVVNIPIEVANLVMRCLEKEPARRLNNMNTAIGVLERHIKSGH